MLTDRFPQLKALILDMDGVLWHDREAIGDLPAIFATVRKLGLKFIFATNNATKKPEQYVARFAAMGLEVRPRQVLTSAEIACDHLASVLPAHSPVYVIGSSNLSEMIQNAGLYVLPSNGILEDSSPSAGQAKAVVVGLDREINYQKLAIASGYVRQGALFVATNTDVTYPTPEGLMPGAGCMVAAVQASSGVAPLVMGKPFPGMYREALARLQLSPSEVLCVGDRLETDIAGAQNANCPTALVLSGVATMQDAKAWPTPIDIIAPDLSALIYS